ncbi:MAG: biotin--[acetyl-CoA-carboxylase] ligase [Deltaproteobacteria bacterium RBG_13_58_19]|nr:MAG: biotin--[acetyl-CoA-carboxylase] ligase [Deltaproteobacteria bacterium RBG_13_58_19]
MHLKPDKDAVLATILGALKEAAAPLSGEVLAAGLGLSRAAVWKRIHRLKALGYAIEGSPRRGYRLLGLPDKLLPAEITQGLKTRYLQGPIHHFETLPSTNDLAKELGSRNAPEGTLVVAESQSRGRGRLGRDWDSPPGLGLYVSLLLRPPLPPTEMPRITLTVAVAVVRALKRAAGVAPGIKWPNDLLVQGKKVGGILTEMETESDRIRHLVVGLGLNVNNREFPPPLHLTATSLALATGASFSRRLILQAWLEEFEALYDLFLNQDFAVILEEWRQYNVTLGRTVTVRQGPREISGLALEVAGDGALLIRQETGEIVRVTSGEIAPGPGTGPEAGNIVDTTSSFS